ncbi:MAG: gfo/Idh/MocA family oxidoreductase [Desulfuromonadales bacterium]|nr:MAG: gfo/Idh/MocA family oxidoreductase [Desulfuromonadales bacterium]
MRRNFALIGVGGYIAPRHLQAIRDTGNVLVAALDKSDSVGIIDRYFDNVSFFTEFERFDRHAEKLRRMSEEQRIHYVSICTPNYLHDSHIRFALRIGADAICEKPLVLNPWNLDALALMEEETGGKIYNILQLRVHPAIVALKEQIAQEPPGKKHNIDLTYITSRGNWYYVSWKGDIEKSGGVATNIGIHFFDMLMWIFGEVKLLHVDYKDEHKIGGYLELARANVRWFLSLDKSDLPEEARTKGMSTYRSLTMNGEEIEFSDGFTELHTAVYRNILTGSGFGIEDARASINLAYQIRHSQPVRINDHCHPRLKGNGKGQMLKAI